MGRASRGKSSRKSEAFSDDEEVAGSVKVDNDETGSGNDVEATNSSGRKRNVRGRFKASEENQEDEKEDESVTKENGKPQSKRRKKDSEENDSKDDNDSKDENDDTVEDSDQEAEKSISKKKKETESQKKSKVEENGKSPAKSKKKGGKSPQKQEENDDDDDGEEYEVEKIVDQRTIKGRRQFLVRWKGYTAESDTWEQEKELNCDRLIEEFLAEQEENNESEKEEEEEKEEKEKEEKEKEKPTPTKKTKAKKQDKKSKQKKTSKTKNDVPKKEKDEAKEGDDNEEDDDETEYEVERIIEVHFKKDKKREFLIRWKGFSAKADTWEPEEHLNCPELITKFMEKVEKAKSIDARELRVNPSHTKRYTLTMHADKRQSRRNADKERVHYYDYDA